MNPTPEDLQKARRRVQDWLFESKTRATGGMPWPPEYVDDAAQMIAEGQRESAAHRAKIEELTRERDRLRSIYGCKCDDVLRRAEQAEARLGEAQRDLAYQEDLTNRQRARTSELEGKLAVLRRARELDWVEYE